MLFEHITFSSYSSVSSNPKKLSYYHHIGNDPLVYRTLSEHFELSAKRYGNREAIVSCHEQKRYTYAEALDKVFVIVYTECMQDCTEKRVPNKKVNRLASGFINIGLNKGDRIGIWSPNSAQWYITLLAAAKAGLVSVNVIYC